MGCNVPEKKNTENASIPMDDMRDRIKAVIKIMQDEFNMGIMIIRAFYEHDFKT